MTIVPGPTWTYEQRDKLVTLGHAAVECVMGRYLTPDTVLRETKVDHEIRFISGLCLRFLRYAWKLLEIGRSLYRWTVMAKFRQACRCLPYTLVVSVTLAQPYINHLVGTLKPQFNGPLYNNAMIGTLAADG